MRVRWLLSLSLLTLTTHLPALRAEDAERAQFFESSVRPVLEEHCIDCHSAENAESELAVDSLTGLLRGGLRGPAVVAGRPEESLLIRVIRHGELLKMPPKSKLAAHDVTALAKWITDGAFWPNADPVPLDTNSETDPLAVEFTNQQRAFWSFQQPVDPGVPEVQDEQWGTSPIDAFVLGRLESSGLAPAPQADRRTLIRRVTFDLTGLPPTREEVDAFLNDDSPDAFGRVVDRLLASPHYGERWGRHWLDVARYADSNGLDENLAYANAYRYRDYVIRAFNSNKSIDRFLQEQIAGDLLAPLPGDPQSQFDGLIATAFLCIGPKMLAEDDPVKLQMDLIDEQIDTMGRAYLGLTFGCARCHDHKFDPVPMSDYYSLAGIFKSTQTMDTFTVVARWHERPLATPEAAAARDAHQKKIDAVSDEYRELHDQSAAAVLMEAQDHVGDYLLAAEELRREREYFQNAKLIGNLADTDRPDGTLILEAENYDRGNVIKDRTNYGKGIGVLVNRGETPNFVEHDLELPAAGAYQIEIRYAAAGSRPCQLAINGQTVAARVAGNVTGSWQPDGQRWEIAGIFDLTKGQNTLRLEQPTFFPHIDKLLLTPAPNRARPTLGRLQSEYVCVPSLVEQWADWLTEHRDDAPDSLRAWLTATTHADDYSATASTRLRHQAAEFQSFYHTNSATELRSSLTETDGPFAEPESFTGDFPESVQASLSQLQTEREKLQKSLPAFPQAMAVEETKPENVRIHFRGSHLTLGAETPRRFPRVLAGLNQTPIAEHRSGRQELAEWLTSPTNPLTARVFVNRVWQWHFGQGLVRSPDNFGQLGERPTHPQLLDWLTVRFVASGWNLKALHQLILRSSTWQMSTQLNEAAYEIDPDNRLLWRMNRRRLEAEAIRDGVLVVTGQLDQRMSGSMLPTANRKYVTSTANVDPVAYKSSRRSVYLPVVRSALYDVFQAFDFADPNVISGTRQSTTVAPQALFMMNSEFVSELTRSAAERLLSDPSVDDAARLQSLWQAAYSRPATQHEIHQSLDYLDRFTTRLNASNDSDAATELADRLDNRYREARLRAWQSICRIALAANEFVYLE
ncbi:MAG: DUF1553 domain-containing protein [Planctomycetota bacterium]|jgi:hypothetical protein